MSTERTRAPAWELFARYAEVFSRAWEERAELTLPALEPHEAEFLPAALEIEARPVSPVGRLVARVLMALIACLLVWSGLGRMDIVVTAEGKLIPTGYTKEIASVDVASVRLVHVEEGQVVKAGDVLVELDSREVDSERDRALADWQNARLQYARAEALLSSLARGSSPRLAQLAGVPAQRWGEAQGQLQDQWRDLTAKRARLDAAKLRYEEELPLATRRAADIAELAKSGDVSRHDWLEAEQARIEIARQLDDTVAQLTTLESGTRKDAQDELASAERTLAESAQDERRASVHGELLRLVAPVDGTVQELTVHTVGGVVPAAQPLMQIVPLQQQVQMEAFLENKDVGFVSEGQAAAVKIDAFDYTKYGIFAARVIHVSRDAIHDEKRGPLYSVKVALERSKLQVDGGRTAALEPGMSGTVEIKTGSRRVIEYLLSPLIRHGGESLRER
ncbi:MAG TPA: HlyD family type I secretion periplasmic adaptor subunit [Steroidobacteraceae bacterium]|jgi:hemolysin D|nr:HlyD family type I secretion periplasmic adaptor subunit [Steroidobacteraceae bacterium]